MRGKVASLVATRRHEINRVAILFMLPAFFFIVVFIAYPIAQSMYLSLFKWDGFATVAPVFAGFDNWRKLVEDRVCGQGQSGREGQRQALHAGI